MPGVLADARKPAAMGDLRNPYAPPATDLAPPTEAAAHGAVDYHFVDASKQKRFLNLVIDDLVIATVAIGSTVILAMADTRDPELVSAVSQLGWYVATFVYYVFSEAVFGRTLGKVVTGTRVVTLQGGRPRFGQIVGRTLLRFVPFDPVSFVTRRAPGWHDRWSRTRVVLTS